MALAMPLTRSRPQANTSPKNRLASSTGVRNTCEKAMFGEALSAPNAESGHYLQCRRKLVKIMLTPGWSRVMGEHYHRETRSAMTGRSRSSGFADARPM